MGSRQHSSSRSASALEGTQPNRHKVMRQQNRESPAFWRGRNLCHVFQHILFLRSSSWSLSPSPSSPRSAAWRRRTTWIFWRGWYRKVSSVNLFLEKSPSNFCFRVFFFFLCERTSFPHCSTHAGSSLVHFLHLILLYFAIVWEMERVREAGDEAVLLFCLRWQMRR